jgi:hypothetical protein
VTLYKKFIAAYRFSSRNKAFSTQISLELLRIAQQQFLIDGPRDICQKLFPIHRRSPSPLPSLLTLSMGDGRVEDKSKCGR